MIPKIVHYCWFGRGAKSELICKCIDSWRKYLPDYQIIEWNEENFDVNSCQFTKEAYRNKKWAFVSDYVRLYALFQYGGIYFDTDVEVLKSFDSLLNCGSFFTCFESKDFPAVTAVMASEPGFSLLKNLINQYEKMSFENEDGSLNLKPNTFLVSDTIASYGIKRNGRMQRSRGITVFPQIYFCPNNVGRIWDKSSPKSYAIHHFDQSWRTEDKRSFQTIWGRIRRYLVGVLKNTIGIKGIQIIWKLSNNS